MAKEEQVTSASGNVRSWRAGPDRAGDGDGDGDERARSPRRQRSRRAELVVVVALGLGGVLGALARYGISLALPTETGRFPWGTFLVNMSGSAALGFLLILLIEQFPRGHLARPVLGTGVLGAYTTFSTYAVEAVLLVRAGHVATALAYVLTTVVGGLIAVWSGMTGARVVMRAERWIQQESR